jgi:predicted permease
MRGWVLRVAGLFNQKRRDHELAEELGGHLRLHIEDNLRAGMTPVEARRQALIKLGGIEQTRQTYRDRRGIPLVEALVQDVYYALRVLRKSPGFAVIAIVTLALGIGGTTAIFSVVYHGLLDPFPYRDSHRLAVVVARSKHNQPVRWARVSVSEFQAYREKTRAFDEVLGMAVGLAAENIGVIGTDPPEILDAQYVTGNTFRVLGMPPLLGRPITNADCEPDAPLVAVLSFKYWHRRFGADPYVIGRTFQLAHRPVTIVGVMPPRFSWGGAEMWLPAAPSGSQGTGKTFKIIGHLKAGVTMRQAGTELAVLSKALAAVYPKDHPKGVSFGIESLIESAGNGAFRDTLYILLGAVGLLLGVACFNVANLFLARVTTRGRETAIRVSVGAGRFRIVRQFMIESLVIAVAGGCLGCIFARTVLDAFVAYLPLGSITSEAEVTINGPVLTFALTLALLSPMLFGLAPSLLAVRKDPLELINSGTTRTDESCGHGRLRSILVVSQVAVSLVLLAGAAMLIRSFFALRYVDLGYNTQQVLSVALGLPDARYHTSEQKNRYYIEALRRSRGVPGVVSAAVCTFPPMWGMSVAWLEISGKVVPEGSTVQLHLLSDGYHETMGIPFLKGRDISEQDIVHENRVAVVNRAFASQYFGATDPLGAVIRLGNVLGASNPAQPMPFEIIGVAGDTRDNGPSLPVSPQVYVPFTISGFAYHWILLRTALDPVAMLKPVRRSIADIDKELPVGSGGGLSNGPMNELVNLQFIGPRFVLCILSAFASLGISLVAIGVYGVLSYAVSQRAKEIGIRIAIGARAQDVRWWVLRTGLRWLSIGVCIGVPASIVLAKIMQNRIWGIKSVDPFTLGAAVLVMLSVGSAACYFPARRATKADPMQALRLE